MPSVYLTGFLAHNQHFFFFPSFAPQWIFEVFEDLRGFVSLTFNMKPLFLFYHPSFSSFFEESKPIAGGKSGFDLQTGNFTEKEANAPFFSLVFAAILWITEKKTHENYGSWLEIVFAMYDRRNWDLGAIGIEKVHFFLLFAFIVFFRKREKNELPRLSV